MEARDCAIWSLDSVGSATEEGSGVARGDRDAFSVATIDRGRLRGRSEDWELGRRCQDKGEFLEGMALEGEAFMETFRLESDSVMTRSATNGEAFSFVGDDEAPVSLSIASLIPFSCCESESPRGSIFGENDWAKVSACVPVILDAIGVLAGEDLAGEIDLARSEVLIVSCASKAR